MNDIDPEILIEGQTPPPGQERYTVGQRIGLRFLALFALAIFALWGVIALLSTLAALICYGFTVGRTREFLLVAKRYWGGFCFTCAGITGSVVALFSPRFGIGVVLIYLLLQADEQTGGRFMQNLRAQFQTAFHRF